jgi:3-polyprenyl-4-hydroxybenzoate decarboxylase
MRTAMLASIGVFRVFQEQSACEKPCSNSLGLFRVLQEQEECMRTTVVPPFAAILGFARTNVHESKQALLAELPLTIHWTNHSSKFIKLPMIYGVVFQVLE